MAVAMVLFCFGLYWFKQSFTDEADEWVNSNPDRNNAVKKWVLFYGMPVIVSFMSCFILFAASFSALAAWFVVAAEVGFIISWFVREYSENQ
jgi:hypothetical protein